MMHRAVKRAARLHNRRNAAGQSYNNAGFDVLWANVADTIRAADIAFANLETPLAPKHHRGIWGEIFNAPKEVADSLASAGFDVLSFANNHTFDQWGAGILETIAHVRAAGMRPIGSGANCAEAQGLTIMTVKGVRIGFIAVSDLMNINENPKTTKQGPCTFVAGSLCATQCGPSRHALFYSTDVEHLSSILSAAKKRVDILILSFHWGIEYITKPLSLYKSLAPRLIHAGADVILGHHAHVLQPVERIQTQDGREGIIVYGLGNFISDMASTFNPKHHKQTRGNTRDGMLLELRFEKKIDGTMHPRKIIPHLLWTQNDSRGSTGLIRTILQDEDPQARERREHVLDILGL